MPRSWRIRRSASPSCSVSWTSRPEEGSSSSITEGSEASARATSTNRPVPSGTDTAGRSATASSPSNERICSTDSASPGPGRSPRPIMSRKKPVNRWRPSLTRRATTRCSRTVSSVNSSIRWNVRASPRRARACGLRPVMSSPFISTRPPRGCRRPESTPKSVVLPAPFGPTRPTVDPGGTDRLTPSSATTPPKRMVMFSAARTGAGNAAAVGASTGPRFGGAVTAHPSFPVREARPGSRPLRRDAPLPGTAATVAG